MQVEVSDPSIRSLLVAGSFVIVNLGDALLQPGISGGVQPATVMLAPSLVAVKASDIAGIGIIKSIAGITIGLPPEPERQVVLSEWSVNIAGPSLASTGYDPGVNRSLLVSHSMLAENEADPLTGLGVHTLPPRSKSVDEVTVCEKVPKYLFSTIVTSAGRVKGVPPLTV